MLVFWNPAHPKCAKVPIHPPWIVKSPVQKTVKPHSQLVVLKADSPANKTSLKSTKNAIQEKPHTHTRILPYFEPLYKTYPNEFRCINMTCKSVSQKHEKLPGPVQSREDGMVETVCLVRSDQFNMKHRKTPGILLTKLPMFNLYRVILDSQNFQQRNGAYLLHPSWQSLIYNLQLHPKSFSLYKSDPFVSRPKGGYLIARGFQHSISRGIQNGKYRYDQKSFLRSEEHSA